MKKAMLAILMIAVVCFSTFGLFSSPARAETIQSNSPVQLVSIEDSSSELQQAVLKSQMRQAVATTLLELLAEVTGPMAPTAPVVPVGPTTANPYICNSQTGQCTCNGFSDCIALAESQHCVIGSANCDINTLSCSCTWGN